MSFGLPFSSGLYFGNYTKTSIEEHPFLSSFIHHCCQVSHYSFDILKCGDESCNICKPVRLPREVFNRLSHLPHPMPGEDGHYLAFSLIFGKPTSEKHRPSLCSKKSKSKYLSFYPSVQHVKNAQLMVQCEECEIWRLVFSKKKNFQKAVV